MHRYTAVKRSPWQEKWPARKRLVKALAILAVVVACLLWWTYVGWLKEALDDSDARVKIVAVGHGAIEVYPGPATVPLQWKGPGAACGLIVIWTKH